MVSQFPWNQANVMVQDNILPVVTDQVFLSNAALARARQKQKTFTGGRRIVAPLLWRTQGGIKWFSGTDVFAPTVRDPYQAAEFTPKNANVDLTIDWDEEMQVSGKNQVLDLMANKGEAARNTFADGLASDFYNDGTDPKALGGLQFALKDFTGSTAAPVAPTMTYGGISRSNTLNTWWNHQGDNGPGGAAYGTGSGANPFAGDNFNALSRAFARVKLASGKVPTLGLSNVGAYSEIHYNLVKQVTYQRPSQPTDLAKQGFETFMFRNTAFVQDEKAPRTAGRVEKLYLLYEPGCRLYVDSRADMAFEPFRKPHNQMVRTAYILWRGEWIVTEPRAQFVFSQIDASNVS